MKQTKALMLLLCISTHSFAGIPLAQANSWKIGVEGGFFTQDSDGTGYTYDLSDVYTPSGKLVYVEPNAKFSGGLNIGYNLKNGQDINISLFLRKNNASSSNLGSEDFGTATTRSPDSWDGESALFANSNFSYESKELNLTFGQMFLKSSQSSFHPYTGLALRKVVSNQTTKYFDYEEEEGENATVTERSKAEGIGIVVGADLNWYFSEQWAITVDANIAFLSGKIKSSYTADNNFGEDYYDLTAESKQSIFQQVTAKIGLSKSFMFTNQPASMLLGYRISGYSNAVQSHLFRDDNNDNSLVSSFSNTGYSGAYASLNLNIS